MIDYAEGVILIKQTHRDLYDLILKRKFGEAAEKADELEKIAKLLKQKLEQEAIKLA